MGFPMHERYRKQKVFIASVMDFVQWAVSDDCPRPKKPQFECDVCGIDGTVPLHYMKDEEKLRLVLAYFEIDYDAFKKEQKQLQGA